MRDTKEYQRRQEEIAEAVSDRSGHDLGFTLAGGRACEPPALGDGRRGPSGGPLAVQSDPRPCSELRAAEAPTLEVWLVTISAATQLLTSSALLKSCNRYLSWT